MAKKKTSKKKTSTTSGSEIPDLLPKEFESLGDDVGLDAIPPEFQNLGADASVHVPGLEDLAKRVQRLEEEIGSFMESINSKMQESSKPVKQSKPCRRLASVAFSGHAESVWKTARKLYQDAIDHLERELPEGREKALALTALEDSYLRVGRSCRDLT